MFNRNGEEKSGTAPFSELVKAHTDKAYRFAFRLTRNEADAMDLVQDAFVNALEHMDHYDPSRPFGPWLNQILKNVFLNWTKRYERHHSVSLETLSPGEDGEWEEIIQGNDPAPLQALGRKETQALVKQALERLPDHYRIAVTLCDLEDYPYKQISEILGCPVGTVRSRIHQGRLLMRQFIQQWEEEENVNHTGVGTHLRVPG